MSSKYVNYSTRDWSLWGRGATNWENRGSETLSVPPFCRDKRLRRSCHFEYVRGKNVTNVGCTGNRTRDPSHARRPHRPLRHGVYRHLTYLSWYPGGFSIYYYIKLATNSASWLYYVSLVLGRERQYRNLNTINCEPRPFSIRF